LIKFRKRIGEKGSEQLLKISVQLFPSKEVQVDEVLLDNNCAGEEHHLPDRCEIAEEDHRDIQENSR